MKSVFSGPAFVKRCVAAWATVLLGSAVGMAHAGATQAEVINMLSSAGGSGSFLHRTRAPIASDGTLGSFVVMEPDGSLRSLVEDAMAVSVLQESPDGTLRSRGMDAQMRTGDRLRIKVLASRAGNLSIYNTTPKGELKPQPVWTGQVRPGEETVSQRLILTGHSGGGIEQLHVVLEPTQAPTGVVAWVGQWLGSVGSGVRSARNKDVMLDVENTPTATYLFSPHAEGRGLVTTLSVAHH